MGPIVNCSRLGEDVLIHRDSHGVPHIFANNERDAYFGLGYCMAQDRPRQLRWLRRKAAGRLAEVFGDEYLERDLEARTVGFRALAWATAEVLDPLTMDLLWGFADGLTEGLTVVHEGHRAVKPWTPVDTLAVLKAFAWQLSGRLHQITAVELAQTRLPAHLVGPFLGAYDGGSSIREPLASAQAGTELAGPGSNNWVVGGDFTATGYPLLASDPHLPPEVPGLFYESALTWGSTMVAGLSHAGVPGFMIGRNKAVAWGITNNLCSTRDLYYVDEPTGGREVVLVRRERINMRDAPAVTLNVRAGRSGTIVTHLLDEPFRSGPPISLRWIGHRPSDEIGALLGMPKVETAEEFRAELSRWVCPTWNFVVADRAGALSYHCVGTIPLRGRRRLGIRDGADAEDAWQALVPTTALPSFDRPPNGRLVTANNRVDGTDRTTEQSGFWVSSARADRIHSLLADGASSIESFAKVQFDRVSMSSLQGARQVVEIVGPGKPDDSAVLTSCLAVLESWDGDYDPSALAPTVYEAFWRSWVTAVVREYFIPKEASLVATRAEPFAHSLLLGTNAEWFERSAVVDVVRAAWKSAVADLERDFGDDVASWTWGRVHVWPRTVGEDFSFAGCGVGLPGGRNTVNNSHHDLRVSFEPTVLAANRVLADLSPGGGLLTASCTGNRESEPAQAQAFNEWLRGDYHDLWLSKSQLSAESAGVLTLTAEAPVRDWSEPARPERR